MTHHTLKLHGTALTVEAALFCDHPSELVLWAKARLAHQLTSVESMDKIGLPRMLAQISLELSAVFGHDYVVELLDYNSEEPIQFVTDSEDVLLLVDSVRSPITTEYH